MTIVAENDTLIPVLPGGEMSLPVIRPPTLRMPNSWVVVVVCIPVFFIIGLQIAIALYCFFPKTMLRLGYLQYGLYCWVRNLIYTICIKVTISWWQFKAALNEALELAN